MKFALALVVASAFLGASPPHGPAQARRTTVDGTALYKQHCADCHGDDGRGGGPKAAAMHFLPGDLTAITSQNHGVFPSERVRQIVEGRGPAAHGNRLMPVWGDVFTRSSGPGTSKQRIDAVVRFLDSIQRRATN